MVWLVSACMSVSGTIILETSRPPSVGPVVGGANVVAGLGMSTMPFIPSVTGALLASVNGMNRSGSAFGSTSGVHVPCDASDWWAPCRVGTAVVVVARGVSPASASFSVAPVVVALRSTSSVAASAVS